MRLLKERLFILQNRKSSNGRLKIKTLGGGRCGRWLHLLNSPIRNGLIIIFGHGAIARNMSSVAAFVAHLTRGVERASIGRSAITRDVSLLSLDLYLHEILPKRHLPICHMHNIS